MCKVSCKLVKSLGFEKVDLGHFTNLREKNSGRKWAQPVSGDSTQLSERVDVRFLNFAIKYMGVIWKNTLSSSEIHNESRL